MKVGFITKTSSRGQIVIPREMRIKLGIEKNDVMNLVLRGGGIYMYPVKRVITKEERESSYVAVLKKTQGAWAGDNWQTTRKRRKELEIKAAKKGRSKW